MIQSVIATKLKTLPKNNKIKIYIQLIRLMKYSIIIRQTKIEKM